MNVKVSKRKYYKRKAAKKNRRVYRRKTIAPMETACIKETLTLSDIQANQAYEPQLNLTQFTRALDIADNYQKYRISKVEYIYKPRYDTFVSDVQPGTSNVSMSVPYLFSKVLDYPAPTAFGVNFLTTMGAKPRRLDDKNVIVSYTPHVLQGGLDAVAQGTTTQNYTRPLKKPWLNTHTIDSSGNTLMDNTTHFGHAFIVQQETPNPNALPVCALDVNVYVEFCKPWDLASQSVDAVEKINPVIKTNE